MLTMLLGSRSVICFLGSYVQVIRDPIDKMRSTLAVRWARQLRALVEPVSIWGFPKMGVSKDDCEKKGKIRKKFSG